MIPLCSAYFAGVVKPFRRALRLACLLIAFLAFSASPAALAAGEDLQALLDEAVREQVAGNSAGALSRLLAQEHLHAGQPAYDYLLGVLALETGEYGLALHALERTTLRMPSHAGAWMDLALVHIHLGEYQTAETLMSYVESTFPVGERVRQRIARLQNHLDEARRAGKGDWQAGISLRAGYTDNANSGLAVRGMLLTPVGEAPVYLEIDPSRRPRADTFVQTHVVAQKIRAEGDWGRQEWTLQYREKRFRQVQGYDLNDVGLAYARENHRLVYGGVYQRIFFGGAPLLDNFLVHAGLRQGLLPACLGTARLELEQRQYRRRGAVDADIAWGVAELACRDRGGAFDLQLRAGEDRPHGARPGGPTRRIEASLNYRHLLGGALVLEARLLQGLVQDADGYSVLLDNHRVRRVHRQGWQLGLNWSPGGAPGGGGFFLVLDQQRESSNLPLFDLAERQIWAGWQASFR